MNLRIVTGGPSFSFFFSFVMLSVSESCHRHAAIVSHKLFTSVSLSGVGFSCPWLLREGLCCSVAAAEHCRKMKLERAQMQREAAILKQEIESLNSAIR